MTPEKAAEVVHAVEAVVGPCDGVAVLDDAVDEVLPTVLLTWRTTSVALVFGNLRGLPVQALPTTEDVLLLRRALGQDETKPLHAGE